VTEKRLKVGASTSATILALLACYGTLAFVSILALAGITVPIDEGWWAISITIFYALAVAVIAFGSIKKQAYGPAILGLTGLALILWVMFRTYHWATELAVFVILITAAVWDRSSRSLG